ncbi:MAG: hypothetical protein J2P17_01770 [Mycobacterium sp.]|nr:hypothetical protein [Mycobacterium sp.]
MTVQEVTGDRVAAISVPVNQTEKSVTIIELKKRGDSGEKAMRRVSAARNYVAAALSTTNGSGWPAACAEQYRQQRFTRRDV